MNDKLEIRSDGANVGTETVMGWGVALRRGRYIREYNRATDVVDLVTSHPEEAYFTTKEEASRLAEANIDEADEAGFPKVVYIVVNVTVVG